MGVSGVGEVEGLQNEDHVEADGGEDWLDMLPTAPVAQEAVAAVIGSSLW